MKAPLSLIQNYTDITMSREELLNRIAASLGSIESVEDLEEKYAGVIIAEVVERKDHPDADKLAVYKLNIGKSEVQVAAGDKTLEKGDKVAYFAPGVKVSATVGTSEEIVVEKRALRGIESEGMMASERELDLSGDHKRVMRVDADAKPGDSFAQTYGLNTLVVDIENKALANRGDCFGVIGIAREIAGLQGNKFETPEWLTENYKKIKEEDRVPLEVRNQAEALCPRYMAIVMDNIEVKESPVWLKTVLSTNGVRPINNIVDITNYMMLLTAQPLHAFDYDKITAKDKKSKNVATIVIRQSVAGEKLTTLDGKTVELPEGVTIIADSENPIGLAGIMGGQDTEIDEKTKRIVIECANFDRYNIRRSSMKLGIFTDAVTRFTKALSPELCENVLAETVRMVEALADGKVASLIKDDNKSPANPTSVSISIEKLNSHLGTHLSAKDIITMLENIDYTIDKSDKDTLIVHVPPFRKDIKIPADIHEDIGRHLGYNNIELTLPTRSLLPAPINKEMQFKNRIRQILSSNGLNEILTYNFVGNDSFRNAQLSLDSAYHIKNALSPELEYMRYTLLPSILEKVALNEKEGREQFGLFEINVGHNLEEQDEENLPLERWLLSSAILTKTEVPYYQAKIYTDLLAQKLNISGVNYSLLADTPTKEVPAWIQRITPMFDMNRSAIMYLQGKNKVYIGIVGEPKDAVKNAFGIGGNVAMLELDIEKLRTNASTESRYREPSRFPAVTQDLCFAVSSDTPYEPMKRELEETLNSDNIIAKVEPLDIYQAEKKPKQITFRIQLQNTEKTLQPNDIKSLREKVVKKIQKKFDATLI